MHWIDWCIAVLPVLCVLGIAMYARRYIRGVVDFLAAGRVAGRYVIAVGDMSTMLSVMTLVALVEAKYQTGFALDFWQNVVAPIGLVFSLTGYCLYRYRETKSLSIGQFLEMRYNRTFRIIASGLRTISEMLTNAIAPAVAANFFIYFLGLPHEITVFGCTIPTFACVVALVLFLAIMIIWPAGRISLLITDCFQGLMSYPIFVLIVGFIIYNFSWGEDIAPVMLDRVKGENFLNPFDIEKLRDFNLFAIVVAVLGSTLNRAAWIGNDTSNSGRTPHEQKMAGILGAWRVGFATMMCMLIAITIITVMSNEKFSASAREIRTTLSGKVADEVVKDANQRAELKSTLALIPEQKHRIGVDAPLSRDNNLDTPYMSKAHDILGHDGEGNLSFQKFRTLYQQMMLPIALRKMFPVGLCGVFCLLMVMLLVSTDDSRIFNASSTIIQDVIIPFRKKPLPPNVHVRWLRIASVLVAVFFFVCSLVFVQIDYITMLVSILCSMWLGGAGPIMVFGLYSRFGTTTGAFCSLIFGSGTSILGFILQRNWALHIYPLLVDFGWDRGVGWFLETVSSPFNPIIMWKMDAVKFPINSYEIYFISMVLGLIAYVIGSLLSFRRPFNLERMLHRGKYSIDGVKNIKSPWTWKNVYGKLIGITPEYTRGDKIISWCLFGYSFGYKMVLSFVCVLVWNLIKPWPAEWWSYYFFIISIVMAGIVGVISTFWFLIGGIIDTRKLFRDLAARVDNPLDNGMVNGHVSMADAAVFNDNDDDAGKADRQG